MTLKNNPRGTSVAGLNTPSFFLENTLSSFPRDTDGEQIAKNVAKEFNIIS